VNATKTSERKPASAKPDDTADDQPSSISSLLRANKWVLS
jgi:hypothetical protein